LDENEISNKVIGAAIDVHRALGPRLLESAYEDCLSYELDERQIPYERQKSVDIVFKSLQVKNALKVDLLVAGLVVVELKSVDKFTDIHEAQVLTYLRFTEAKLGLLLNFNVRGLRLGIRRLALNP